MNSSSFERFTWLVFSVRTSSFTTSHQYEYAIIRKCEKFFLFCCLEKTKSTAIKFCPGKIIVRLAPWESTWHCFYPISSLARAQMGGIVNEGPHDPTMANVELKDPTRDSLLALAKSIYYRNYCVCLLSQTVMMTTRSCIDGQKSR